MSKLAIALYGFPPGSIVTEAMLKDRKAALNADPRYSDEAIRNFRGHTMKTFDDLTFNQRARLSALSDARIHEQWHSLLRHVPTIEMGRDLFNRLLRAAPQAPGILFIDSLWERVSADSVLASFVLDGCGDRP